MGEVHALTADNVSDLMISSMDSPDVQIPSEVKAQQFVAARLQIDVTLGLQSLWVMSTGWLPA